MAAHLSTTQLSIRASCERCRLHKLKCIASPPNSSASGGRCQRCIRAATECVFSRRSNSKREPASSEDLCSLSQKNTLPTSSPHSATLMQPPMLFDMNETQSEQRETSIQRAGAVIDPGLHFSSPNPQFVAHNPALDCDMGLIDPNIHYQLPLHSLDSQPLHLSIDLGLLTPEAETVGFTGDKISSPSPAGSSASSPSSSSTVSDGQQTYSRRVATKSLLNPALTLEESLDELANQAWEQEGSRSDFGHYPVGSVLHLFQEFIDTVTSVRELRSHDHLRDGQQDFKHGGLPFYRSEADEPMGWQNTTRFAKSTSQLDTSLVLLVLSCYATLTRIGTTVLGHFKRHLEGNTGQRDDLLAAITVDKCDFTATTRLGELAMRTESYTQIHAAFNLLLEMLERATWALAPTLHHPTSQASNGIPSGNFDVALAIEAQMQLADDRTAPLCSRLRESEAGLLSSFAEREENSSELRDLLRRKMGL
ncbi:hypothetical protein F5Y10DRAFT_293725 [Nemania abortiva]|nr:hypothetical protein F5Y10DRAFT_293725 [Nemania abortiva]